MRIFVAIYYFLIFLPIEILKSNLLVARAVIFPRTSVRPGIIAVPLSLKTDWGITLLANSITLTPGTIALDVSEDKKILYVHCLALDNPTSFISAVKNSFEKKILMLEGTRA